MVFFLPVDGCHRNSVKSSDPDTSSSSCPSLLKCVAISFYFIKCVHIQLEVIVAVPSNSTWCTPGIFVPKANGEVCIMLISSTEQDHKEGLYTVPRVDRL